MLRPSHLLLALALAQIATAQSEKHPELGLTLDPPTGYERLPVRPKERFGALAYVKPQTQAEQEAGQRRSSLELYLVPRTEGDPVLDGETFLRHVLGASETQEQRVGRERYGYGPKRWTFELNEDGKAVSGWMHAWESDARSYLILGRCEPGRERGEQGRWERCAEDLRLFEPAANDAERGKWERYYGGRRGLVGIERRIQARLDLVEGWKMRDSDHYIVLSHGVDEGFVIEMTSAIETMRGQYAKLCPPDGVLDEVSIVRVCRDREEYLAYGGRKGSVGYWSPGEEELVLFDARGESDGEIDGEHYTQAVLCHETFHQYVHYAAEGIAPHPWFDEGLAEYFGGAIVSGRRFSGIEPNRYRLETAQSLLEQGAYSWYDTTRMEQAAYYADPVRLYAQGWSMTYFLAASAEARRHRVWSEILPTYLRTLRAAWLIERRRLAGGGSVESAMVRARQRAWSEAFQGVDWDELETAWRRHVAGLRMPSAR